MRDSFAEELTSIQHAEQELKRIDHLIYVSLKYTRTVDVFKNVLTRMVTTGDYMKDALLEMLKDQEKIDSIPDNRAFKADILKKEFKEDENLMEFMHFHQMVRRIDRAEFTRKNEFRRHVTMTVMDGADVLELKIETLTDYFKRMKEYFVNVIETLEANGIKV